ncbi:uncharacterized protein [Aegilops tauschii subsp. strangulata]|uniref:uncharacterized protein n=1 Tax=Aegilops tauschii subsp. strangulata TaxID=200361 RepID=UPI003CC8B6EA
MNLLGRKRLSSGKVCQIHLKRMLVAVELLQPLPIASPKAHCQAVVAYDIFEGIPVFAAALCKKRIKAIMANKKDYHFLNVQMTAFHHEKLTLQRCE